MAIQPKKSPSPQTVKTSPHSFDETEIQQLKQENTINSASWIVTNIYDSYNDLISNENNCKLKYTTYPEKIMNLNNNWRRLKLNWYIIYCQ